MLEYVPPFSTGIAASLELGQPADQAFISKRSRVIGNDNEYELDPSQIGPTLANLPFNRERATDDSLYGPRTLAFDPDDDLWVVDNFNSRVLEFVPPFSNGVAATAVLGHEDFRHWRADPVPKASSMVPSDVSVDGERQVIIPEIPRHWGQDSDQRGLKPILSAFNWKNAGGRVPLLCVCHAMTPKFPTITLDSMTIPST